MCDVTHRIDRLFCFRERRLNDKMNRYDEMRKRQQEAFNKLPIKFAYGEKQFKEMLKEFGIEGNPANKLFRMTIGGGYYLKTDADQIRAWQRATTKELADAIAEDTTGEGFISEMFYSELSDHEYNYTMDDEYTLDVIGYSRKEIESNSALKNGFELAKQKIIDEQSCNETMDMNM